MIRVLTPATSANLGPGFDCLGVAYDLYNEFLVELSDELKIEGCEEKYAGEDNLFYVSFRAMSEALGRHDKCHVIMKTDIPVSRGLGSSASLICAGALSAATLYGLDDKDLVFQIATRIEGHPDNVAPCLYGSLTQSMMAEGRAYTSVSEVSKKMHFTLLIPDYELSTAYARSVLPQSVSREDAVFNVSHALMSVSALKSGDHELLALSCDDRLHQPYRKALIKDYDQIKDACLKVGASAFMISGAGPTMLAVSPYEEFSKRLDLSFVGKIIDLHVDDKGARIL